MWTLRTLTRGFAFSIVLVWMLWAFAWAGDSPKHSRVIDFEDEVVEGMNKRPLDSLNQISERDRNRNKPHLYRKRASFNSETTETLRTLRYAP